MSRVIAPLIRDGKWPASSAALLTAHLCLPGEAHSAESKEGPPHEAHDFLRKCLLPELELLLPNTMSTAQGECFFIVVFADEDERSVVARRIQEQFQDSRILNNGGRTLSLSYSMLPAFARRIESSAAQAAAEMAENVESAIFARSQPPGLQHERQATVVS